MVLDLGPERRDRADDQDGGRAQRTFQREAWQIAELGVQHLLVRRGGRAHDEDRRSGIEPARDQIF